jgi:hypothetical protein
MRTLSLGLVVCFVSAGSAAYAAVTAVPGGYEVSYHVYLPGGTSNGQDIRSVFLVEWDESGHRSVDHAFSIAGRGSTRLAHVVGFRPSAALVIGYAEGIAGVGDGKDHLFTLTSAAFAEQATGQNWGVVFPGVPPEPRVGHNAMTALLQDAAAGDGNALDAIVRFVDTEGHRAAFDPAGRFRVIEWTIGTPIDGEPIPTLSTVGLAALALFIVVLASRRLGNGTV